MIFLSMELMFYYVSMAENVQKELKVFNKRI